MRGLAQGEQSTATNPILQLFTRQGEFLTDPVSGSYQIDQIADPDGAVVARVGNTSLNIAEVGSGGHKLGTGRFYIPTGDTALWTYGTHRVLYSYVMETGGRTYNEIIEFEILNPVDFPSGMVFTTYATTRSLYQDGFFVHAITSPDKLHRHLSRESKRLEGLLDRWFEPRYLTIKLNGEEAPVFMVNEAIIAIEKVEAVSRSPNSNDAQTTLYDKSSYRVYNRHLNGLLNPDDRYNPRISLVTSQRIAGVTPVNGSFNWPFGRQNIQLTGVFGFTDPDRVPDEVLIGHTPEEFSQILGTLATRYMENPTMSSLATWKPGLIKSYRTRDQKVDFFGSSGNVSYTGGLTGDSLVDQLLQRFVKPARLSYPDRETYTGGY